MIRNGWNQSELARNVIWGADSTSQYVRGRSVPTPGNLNKLANILGVEPEALFPNYDAQTNAIEAALLRSSQLTVMQKTCGCA